MPKQILFVITNLGNGGTNRSLQNLLNKIDTSRYAADVFVMAHQGPYGKVFENCTLIKRNSFIHALIADLKQQKGLNKVLSIIIKLLAKLTKYKFQDYLFNKTSNKISLKKDYAAVIAYSEGVPTRFVYKMKHHNKIAWIHCDYASYLEHNPFANEKELYEAFNSIVCVSEYTKDSFLKFFPNFTEKVCAIYNILDNHMIKKLAQLEPDIIFDKTKFTIVSIGRIDPIKHLSAIPEIARKLLDAGSNICWYIIGPIGTFDEYALLKKNINKYDVHNCVKLLGEKNNPYCYLINANLLVNTSLSEANPYVINEAKILHVPIVCTNFGSAKELIEYGINGYYEPLDKISERINFLVNNPGKYNSIKIELSFIIYDNDAILSKVYLLINKN